jgi:formylglycine-generating enzyme required for sulfatase activity
MLSVSVLAAICLLCLFGACGRGPKPGQVILVNGNEMVYIPGGTFTMGDSSIGTVRVTLKPYLIDKREVTNAQYRAFAKTFGLPFPVPPTYDDLPVVDISWEAADALAAWRGCRLPTEAEWEFAARGTDGRQYPWGDDPDLSKTNGDDGVGPFTVPDGSKDGFAGLAPVGMFPEGASPFGVLDMAGNVWEWVEDWYAPYPDSAVTDYHGPDDGERKVLRGGSYIASMPNHRTFHRAYRPPTGFADDMGFRCVRSYPPPKKAAGSATDQ